MKTLSYLLLSFFLVFQSAACTGSDKVIGVNDLPKAAQTLIQKHFSDKQVSFIQKDTEGIGVDYDVVLSDGTKIEFDSKGKWKKIDCKPQAVPAALIPQPISNYVKQAFPGASIVKIEIDRRGYEIDLSNGLDVKFSKNFKVLEVDD